MLFDLAQRHLIPVVGLLRPPPEFGALDRLLVSSLPAENPLADPVHPIPGIGMKTDLTSNI